MKNNKKSKPSEGAPVAADAPSATHNNTADQAEASSSHGEQHISDPPSDKPGDGGAPHQVDGKSQSRTSGSKTIKDVATEKLKFHPLSSKIYTSKISGSLVASVQEHGVMVPLLVAPDTNEVIAGNSRLAAAIQAGLLKVPVIYFGSSDELDIRQAILETNNQREKNTEQKLREYLEWLDIEKESSKRRMANKSAKDGGYNSTQADTGKSRDKAALKIGMSGLHADRGGQVVKVIDDLASKGDDDKAKALVQRLNDRSINAAYNLAIEGGFIIKAKKEAVKAQPANSKVPNANPKKASLVPVPTQAVPLPEEEEDVGGEFEFPVESHNVALGAVNSVTKFAAQLKPGEESSPWRPKWVESVNALCEALTVVGLITHNVESQA